MSLLPATASPQGPVTFHEGRMFRITGLTEADKATLREMLTIPNPRRLAKLRYSAWVDESEPKELYGFADLAGDAMLIAPGAAASAWRMLKALYGNVFYQAPLRNLSPTGLTYTGQSRDYQDETVQAMLARSHAVAVGPCGCGKTDMAIRVQVARDCPWLILVHTKKLRTQWRERICERLGLKLSQVSVYCTTRKKRWDPAAPFVLATVQALRRNLADVATLAAEDRGVWVDECHHTPSTTFTQVLAAGAWRYRYGVTATPKRQDGTTDLMHWWIGPIVATVDRTKVEDSGHLLRPRLSIITTNYKDTYDPNEPGDNQRLLTRLCDDHFRLNTVANAVRGLAEHGRHILVCVDRIEYGEKLVQRINQYSRAKAMICHGQLPQDEQDEVLRQVAAGECRVVIATSLADEGLDLPILDTVVLATPSGSTTRTEQRMGRACRPVPQGCTWTKLEPLVVDVVDPLVQREEVVADPETGETTVRVHRIYVNQFKRRYMGVYRTMTHCDQDEVRRVLRGEARDRISEPTPA